ncbi:DUF1905 domain-containing protein [Nocardioides jiangxiensis]|uniref:DUF1905 domain-containing protein n=1 Tax=Nocardioides jiangxiensis TaxID=3064524 RepID=A0ABT9B172_9ACTN|nr:DUF1905 domain-containing protein [Nocardioides sp. WY-20]MDO7867988.1 DUF1905 domain-containing protein [Nocardioides sp. WY-20]
MSWTFDAELFRWDANASWFFVRLPQELSDEVRDSLTGPPGGFGSVRVEVRIGASRWATSLFPEKSAGAYVLPVKKAVRAAEDLDDGDLVSVEIALEQA